MLDGVNAAVVGVAMLVEKAWVTSGPQHRQKMLQRFAVEKRIALVSELSRPLMWVVVFAKHAYMSSMLTMPLVGLHAVPSSQ
jgi:hypothetical protein